MSDFSFAALLLVSGLHCASVSLRSRDERVRLLPQAHAAMTVAFVASTFFMSWARYTVRDLIIGEPGAIKDTGAQILVCVCSFVLLAGPVLRISGSQQLRARPRVCTSGFHYQGTLSNKHK